MPLRTEPFMRLQLGPILVAIVALAVIAAWRLAHAHSVQCRPKRIPNQLAVIPITVWCRRYAAALRVRGGFFVTDPTHVAVGKH